MIYLIADVDHHFCKIGFAQDVQKRLAQLQTGCPWELYIHKSKPGNMALERAIHEEVKAYKIRGEWFTFCPPVVETFKSMEGDMALRQKMKEVLEDMVLQNVELTGDYETWVDNLLYVMRDSARQYAGQANQAIKDHGLDEPSIAAWKAIIDAAIWGSAE